MKIEYQKVCRDFLAFTGESPDLIPELEEGEDSAVLTIEKWLAVRIKGAALEAAIMTPAHMQRDTVKTTADIWSAADYLKPYSRDPVTEKFKYVPVPEFDGKTLTISEAAYNAMLDILAQKK